MVQRLTVADASPPTHPVPRGALRVEMGFEAARGCLQHSSSARRYSRRAGVDPPSSPTTAGLQGARGLDRAECAHSASVLMRGHTAAP